MKKQIFYLTAIITMIGVNVAMLSVSHAIGPDCSAVTARGDLVQCLAEENYIKLADDIIYEGSSISYNRPENDTTIDLNNYSIINTSPEPSDIFKIKAGTITFTGTGAIGSTDYDSLPLHVYGSQDAADTEYTTINIEPNVSLKAGDSYTLKIDENSGKAFGIKVNFAGKSMAEKGFYVVETIEKNDNHPIINILEDANINATRGHVIVASGYADWNIEKAILSGNSGLGIKSGNFVIDGASVFANGNNNEVPTPNGDKIGMGNSGAAIQIEAIKDLTDLSDLYIKSGSFVSEHGYAIVEYAGDEDSNGTSLRKFKIRTGLLQGTEEFDDSVVTSSTGAFFWYHGDGRIMEAGGHILEVDELYDSHKMTIERFANNVAGLDELVELVYNVEEILPVFYPYEELGYYEAEDLQNSEYKNSQIVDVFDISLRGFDADIGEPEPGMSRPYYIISDTSEEHPVTFNIDLPETNSVEEGYNREYYILNFHWNIRTGYNEIEKIPIQISEDGKTYTFSTHRFSVFALAYEDTKSDPAPSPEEEKDNPDLPPEEEKDPAAPEEKPIVDPNPTDNPEQKPEDIENDQIKNEDDQELLAPDTGDKSQVLKSDLIENIFLATALISLGIVIVSLINKTKKNAIK